MAFGVEAEVDAGVDSLGLERKEQEGEEDE